MKTSSQGIKLLTEFESFSPKAYYDAGGLYSIGYGTLIDSTEESYLRTAIIDTTKGKQLLYKDVAKIEEAINDRTNKLNQNEFDALISFGYNLGKAPVILMVDRINKGWSRQEVANKMLLYTKSDGKTLNGLVKRRQKEVELFLTKPSKTQHLLRTVKNVPIGVTTSVSVLLIIALLIGYKLFYLRR